MSTNTSRPPRKKNLTTKVLVKKVIEILTNNRKLGLDVWKFRRKGCESGPTDVPLRIIRMKNEGGPENNRNLAAKTDVRHRGEEQNKTTTI